MSRTKPASAVNRLLGGLPRKDHQRLLASCEQVELTFGEILCERGERIQHVYFPTEGFISLLTAADGNSLEVGLVGSEGMLGIPLALGVEVSPLRAVVQGSGAAMRMTAAQFRRELKASSVLQLELDRYVYVLLAQLAQMAACTRFHLLEARLAGWLLKTHDRAASDKFHLTHEFLAFMLGVRRVGVTKAAGILQNRNLIAYNRGDITLLDRRGLKALSCECYQAERKTYARFLDARV